MVLLNILFKLGLDQSFWQFYVCSSITAFFLVSMLTFPCLFWSLKLNQFVPDHFRCLFFISNDIYSFVIRYSLLVAKFICYSFQKSLVTCFKIHSLLVINFTWVAKIIPCKNCLLLFAKVTRYRYQFPKPLVTCNM